MVNSYFLVAVEKSAITVVAGKQCNIVIKSMDSGTRPCEFVSWLYFTLLLYSDDLTELL